MREVKIDPTAVVSGSAQLGAGVEIGAFSIIGDDVILGDNTKVMHHSVIDTGTKIGKNCTIYPFCSVGTDPQDITFKGEKSLPTL